MSNLRIAIPEPYQTVESLRATAMATKEAVEILLGQRGNGDDRAVTQGEMPPDLPRTYDDRWNPLPYLNGWIDYGVPYSPCGYRKLANGLVVLRGLVKNGTANPICQLPAGYRPGLQMLYCVQSTPNTATRVDIQTDGVVINNGGANGWVSLCNISFLAEN